MASEKRDLARHNFQCKLMNYMKTCRLASRLVISKAFDKVAHEKILLKLHHYGIRRDTLKIKDFLDNRKQAAVINGINSDKISISSGVR